MKLSRIFLVMMLALLPFLSGIVEARGFRSILPIASPNDSLPKDAEILKERELVRIDLVQEGVEAILKAWNTGELDPLLVKDFFDKSRLLDVLNDTAPKDARLRLLSIRGTNTLQQFRMKTEQGPDRVSHVSAIVDLQIEYIDPQQGFVQLDSTNEFILEVREPIS